MRLKFLYGKSNHQHHHHNHHHSRVCSSLRCASEHLASSLSVQICFHSCIAFLWVIRPDGAYSSPGQTVSYVSHFETLALVTDTWTLIPSGGNPPPALQSKSLLAKRRHRTGCMNGAQSTQLRQVAVDPKIISDHPRTRR